LLFVYNFNCAGTLLRTIPNCQITFTLSKTPVRYVATNDNLKFLPRNADYIYYGNRRLKVGIVRRTKTTSRFFLSSCNLREPIKYQNSDFIHSAYILATLKTVQADARQHRCCLRSLAESVYNVQQEVKVTQSRWFSSHPKGHMRLPISD